GGGGGGGGGGVGGRGGWGGEGVAGRSDVAASSEPPRSPRRAGTPARSSASLGVSSAGRGGRRRLSRNLDDPERRLIREEALQQRQCHVVHGHPARRLALGPSVVSVAVKHDARRVAVDRLLHSARSEKRVDLEGLP